MDVPLCFYSGMCHRRGGRLILGFKHVFNSAIEPWPRLQGRQPMAEIVPMGAASTMIHVDTPSVIYPNLFKKVTKKKVLLWENLFLKTSVGKKKKRATCEINIDGVALICF